MQSLPLRQIRLTDPFWSRWQKQLVDVTLPKQFEKIVETGRLANFEIAAGQKEGKFEGLWFNDSDVYKWLEACAYALVNYDNADLRKQVDQAITAIEKAQDPSGYINTFFQIGHPELKWRNLHMMHEMYCGGHMLEGAVALHECLGDRRLLDVSIRFVDHVMSVFGPDKRRGYCGHEELELALIKLAKATGNAKYREFARWMVEQRGSRPAIFEAELKDKEAMELSPWSLESLVNKEGTYDGSYAQDHAPIREHTEIVGHAVRAMYYYIAAADLADGKKDEALETALERTWSSLTRKRMYVTGGIGPSSHNEGFTGDYDLPNLTSYAETCAAIGLVFWGHRLLEMTGNSEYADVMEKAIFNGALAGISLSGDHYFYANPHESRGTHARVPWFNCACCPPNIARLIGSLGAYAVGVSKSDLFIHLPIGLETEVTYRGVPVKLKLEGNYPWSGEFTLHVDPAKPVEFAIKLRIPAWSDDVSTDVPGADEEADYENGYAVFKRTWKAGDKLVVDLEMMPKWVESDPRVFDNLGRVALTNGPLVYCAEQIDNLVVPQRMSVDVEAPIEVTPEKLLEGVNVLATEAVVETDSFTDELYAEEGNLEVKPATAKFIPYFAWNNRGATHMQVWMRRL